MREPPQGVILEATLLGALAHVHQLVERVVTVVGSQAAREKDRPIAGRIGLHHLHQSSQGVHPAPPLTAPRILDANRGSRKCRRRVRTCRLVVIVIFGAPFGLAAPVGPAPLGGTTEHVVTDV